MRCLCVARAELLASSWRHTTCTPIVRLTVIMDLSRCLLVGVNWASSKSSSMLARPIIRGNLRMTPMIWKHATHTVCVSDSHFLSVTTNEVRLSHGQSKLFLVVWWEIWLTYEKVHLRDYRKAFRCSPQLCLQPSP
jgi:hypothetical protein